MNEWIWNNWIRVLGGVILGIVVLIGLFDAIMEFLPKKDD